MLNSITHFTGAQVTGVDGLIGSVRSVLFDTRSWTVRYLVVGTDGWQSGRKILISPTEITRCSKQTDGISVSLKRSQVEVRPALVTNRAAGKPDERDLLRSVGDPNLWLRSEHLPSESDDQVHDSSDLIGFELRAEEVSLGHVRDFFFDESSWRIRYLLVDTESFWPGSRQLLVTPGCIGHVDHANRVVCASIPAKKVMESPQYHELVGGSEGLRARTA